MSVFLSNQALLEQVAARCKAEVVDWEATITKPVDDSVLSEGCHGALKVLQETMAARAGYKAQVFQRLLVGGVGVMILLLIVWILRRTVRAIDEHLQRLPGVVVNNDDDDDGAMDGKTVCFRDHGGLEKHTLALSLMAADSCSSEDKHNKSTDVAYIGVVPLLIF